MTFKLRIDLIPKPTWGNHLRGRIPKSLWKKLRAKVLAAYCHRCAICGAIGVLACDEVWEFDDRRHIQRLVGLRPLCKMCDHARHLGMAGILALEGRLDLQQVIKHFCEVNGCGPEEFKTHRKEAFEQWTERSLHKRWKVDLGKYADFVELVEPPINEFVIDLIVE